MVKKEEARQGVLREWPQWVREQNIVNAKALPEGMLFYQYLRSERPHLLNYKSSGDKWQDVRGWLQYAGLIPAK